MILICNILFYILFLLLSLVGIPIYTVLLVVVRIFAGKRQREKFLRLGILLYGKVIVFGLARFFIKVIYENHAPEELNQGPYVYIANHRAASDAFLLAGLSGEIVQVVNTWPFKLPVLGAYAKWAGYLSVREMPFEDFSRTCSKLLVDKVSIAAFPEGTRSGDRTVGSFHGALFRVALENKCPIVPVCIMGNEDKPARGTLLMRSGKVHIHSLKAISYEEYKDMNSFKLKQHVRKTINDYITEVEGNLDV